MVRINVPVIETGVVGNFFTLTSDGFVINELFPGSEVFGVGTNLFL